jgi:hypothetical protein
MNKCDRCHRTHESAAEFEHGCKIATHDHGLVFVCGSCMYPGELGQWRERQLIEQIAERTTRRVLAEQKVTA